MYQNFVCCIEYSDTAPMTPSWKFKSCDMLAFTRIASVFGDACR